jgi:hypothetical protein
MLLDTHHQRPDSLVAMLLKITSLLVLEMYKILTLKTFLPARFELKSYHSSSHCKAGMMLPQMLPQL